MNDIQWKSENTGNTAQDKRNKEANTKLYQENNYKELVAYIAPIIAQEAQKQKDNGVDDDLIKKDMSKRITELWQTRLKWVGVGTEYWMYYADLLWKIKKEFWI